MFCQRDLSIAATISLALVLGACAGRPLEGVLVPVAQSAEGTSRVNILVATTRRRATADAGEMFNGERAASVSYADITVSIPPDSVRKIGEIQWPAAPPGDPSRDFATVAADYIDKEKFIGAVAAAAKPTGRRNVLIFVHGFNNRFDDAVYRFAQVVHDAKAPGIPVLFTWPSRGELKLRAYTYDRESANYSRKALEQLIEMLAADRSVKEINIVAHSMGNWVALEALRDMATRSGKIGAKVRFVALVAPDVDVDVFRTEMQNMGKSRPQFLLFASQDDGALNFSKTVWGGVQRIGAIDPAQEPYKSELAQENVEAFDLTKLKGSAHGRAFEDITTTMEMLKDRMGEQLDPLVQASSDTKRR
jgi:esterase/lipase superfamily enzyme